MKIYEIAFSVFCAAFCATMIWCASRLDEPFMICICAFSAAFWGSMSAFCVWARISEPEQDDYWRPAPINNLPNRRRA